MHGSVQDVSGVRAGKWPLVPLVPGLDFETRFAEVVDVRSYADTGIGIGGDTLHSGLDKLAQRPQVAALDLDVPVFEPVFDLDNCGLCHRRPPS